MYITKSHAHVKIKSARENFLFFWGLLLFLTLVLSVSGLGGFDGSLDEFGVAIRRRSRRSAVYPRLALRRSHRDRFEFQEIRNILFSLC